MSVLPEPFEGLRTSGLAAHGSHGMILWANRNFPSGGPKMARRQAPRLNRVQPPATIAAGELARELARQGRDIIDLGIRILPKL